MCPQGTESTCQWRQRLSWYFLQCPSCDTHQMPLKSLQVHKVQICQDDTPSSSPVAPITRWTLLAGLPWLPGWDEEQLGYSQRWHLRRDGTHLATPGTTGAVDALLFAARPRWSFQVPATPQGLKGRNQQFWFMFRISRKPHLRTKWAYIMNFPVEGRERNWDKEREGNKDHNKTLTQNFVSLNLAVRPSAGFTYALYPFVP